MAIIDQLCHCLQMISVMAIQVCRMVKAADSDDNACVENGQYRLAMSLNKAAAIDGYAGVKNQLYRYIIPLIIASVNDRNAGMENG